MHPNGPFGTVDAQQPSQFRREIKILWDADASLAQELHASAIDLNPDRAGFFACEDAAR